MNDYADDRIDVRLHNALYSATDADWVRLLVAPIDNRSPKPSCGVAGRVCRVALLAGIRGIETKSFEDRSAGHAVLCPHSQDATGELASSGQFVRFGAADTESPACRGEIDTDGQRAQLLEAHPAIHAVGLLPTESA